MGFRHPAIGVIPMLLVPAPENSPGVLGLVCHRFGMNERELDSGVIFGGGAGRASDNTVEMVHMFYPAKEATRRAKLGKIPSIDFRGFLKLKVVLRDKIERLLRALFSNRP